MSDQHCQGSMAVVEATVEGTTVFAVVKVEKAV